MSNPPVSLAAFKDVPALLPPPGATSNFLAPNDRGRVNIIVLSIFLGIVYLFMILRMYSKVWIKRSPDPCDVAAVLALVGLTVIHALNIRSLELGIGKHQWDIPLSATMDILTTGRHLIIVIPPTILCIKLSLLVLYLRIFRPDWVTKWLIYFGLVGWTFAYLTIMFFNIFVDAYRMINCSYILGAINVASDFYIICIPIMAASKLQLGLKARVGLILVFMTGSLACIMSIISLVYRLRLKLQAADVTRIAANTMLITTIENDVGLMCACMPFFPVLIKDSPTVQKCFSAIKSLGSRMSGSTRRGSSKSYNKHSGRRFTVVEDTMHLDVEPANGRSSDVTLQSPKKSPRTESVAYTVDDRPQVAWIRPYYN